MIFGTLNPEKIRRLSTSTVRCRSGTLGNRKKIVFNSIIHTYFWLLALPHKKTICNPLAHTPPENIITRIVNCETSSYWRFVAFFQTLEALKRACCGLSSVALKRTACDESQLEWQASNVTASVLKWPPSALIHASSRFRHWSVA